MLKKCSMCKKEKPESDFNKNRTTYDGLQSECRECGRNRRKYKEYICTDCGDSFTRRADYKTKGTCKACSTKRAAQEQRGRIIESMRKGEYINCDNCNKRHYKKKSQLKLAYEKRFCSQKCAGEYSAKYRVPGELITSPDNKGEKNGRYKHGKRVGGHERHKKLKEKMVMRDGKGCILCGTEENIHVHRIMPGALGGKYVIENTVMLCKYHHSEVHRQYDEWKPKLETMIREHEEGKIS